MSLSCHNKRCGMRIAFQVLDLKQKVSKGILLHLHLHHQLGNVFRVPCMNYRNSLISNQLLLISKLVGDLTR